MATFGSLSSADSSHSFKWIIPDFLQSVSKTGDFISSPNFPVWDSNNKSGDCNLKIYLKGKVNSNSVELYLYNQSSFARTLSYSLSLEEKEGNESNKMKFEIEMAAKENKGDNFGSSEFIKLDKLKENSSILLPGGTLTINLNIMKPGPKSGVTSLSEDYQLSFLDEEFSDVKIKVKGETFPCHRYVLASRSPVLKAMVRPGFKEGITGEINLDSMEPEIVKVTVL